MPIDMLRCSLAASVTSADHIRTSPAANALMTCAHPKIVVGNVIDAREVATAETTPL
jgi:hypothetical protein